MAVGVERSEEFGLVVFCHHHAEFGVAAADSAGVLEAGASQLLGEF